MCACVCVCFLLVYTTATAFLLYHGGDIMSEMRRRKSEPTFLPTQGTFNLLHHIGMVGEEPAFDDAVNYTQQEKWISAQLNVVIVTRFVLLSPELQTECFTN